MHRIPDNLDTEAVTCVMLARTAPNWWWEMPYRHFWTMYLIEAVLNVTRRWHQPRRSGDGPVLKKDRPWEHTLYFDYSDHCVFA